jgi:hypothetical protein
VLYDLRESVAPASASGPAISAFTAGQWIGEFAPQSIAHAEIEALAAVVRRKVRDAEANAAA